MELLAAQSYGPSTVDDARQHYVEWFRLYVQTGPAQAV